MRLPPQPSLRVRRDRESRLRWAGIVSLGLHAALLCALLLGSRHVPTPTDTPNTEGSVELVLLEQQGTGPTAAPREPSPSPAVPAPQPQPTPAPPPPPAAEPALEALPLPPSPPPPAPSPNAPDQASLPVPHTQEAPEINLGGNDAETNAIVTGPNVIPASVDAKYHNQEPVYPLEAVRRAQQGAVILLIHVAPNGLPTQVDVAQSSGFVLLDREARDKVMGWHFLPAVRDGQPIPFDMKLRVVFHLD